MQPRRPGLRRRSERLQNNDAATPITTPTPSIQRRRRVSNSSKKKQNGPSSSKPHTCPKRTRDQKTLTQIDFVTRKNLPPDPDLNLDYIEDDVPSPPRKTRNKGNKKKTQLNRNQGNTLTQMDYVARRPLEDEEEDLYEDNAGNDMPYVSGTDDDDDDLERTGIAPRWEAVQNEGAQEPAHTPSPERRAKRRRLENDTHISPSPSRSRRSRIFSPQAFEEKENEGLRSRPSPSQKFTATDSAPLLYPTSQQRQPQHVTPKKQLKWEIPSSQSPDSPGFMLITEKPSSPLKTKSPNNPLAPVSRTIQQTPSPSKVAAWHSFQNNRKSGEGVPRSSVSVKSQFTPQTVETDDETPGTSPMLVNLDEAKGDGRFLPQSPLGAKSKTLGRQSSPDDSDPGKEANGQDANTDHVVHDTDEESEDDFHETHSHLSEQDLDVPPGDMAYTLHGGDSKNCPNHSTAVSDASILYYRKPQNTLRDPTASELSGIDSERLAELFPPNEQETIGPSIPPYSNLESTPRYHPSTQNPLDVSTEFVPMSSQRPAQEGPQEVPCSSPPEVILVESSQPNDQATEDKKSSSHSAPKDMFASSQLLPDSLMEPIQGPPLEWMFSEDSIHE